MKQKGVPKNKPKILQTHPEFVKWMQNQEDGNMYSYGSNIKINWVCPNCGEIVEASISKVISRNHVPCKKCSDGVSYPNKYMRSMLKQLDVVFEQEYMPEWIKPKRFDFFVPSKKLIIEMDGNVGHGRTMFDGSDPIQSLKVDMYKDGKALENGLDVVRIDCIISDSDYIKNSIYESALSDIFDLSKVDFSQCNKDANSSLKMVVCNLWNKYHDMSKILNEVNLRRSTIIRYLKDCTKYDLCDYNPKEQQIKSGKSNIEKAYQSNCIRVICLETNKIFDSCRAAYDWLGYNHDGHSIQDNCKGITLSAGKDPVTNEKLHWMFYDDYMSSMEVSV